MTAKGYLREGASLTEDINGVDEVQVWDVPVPANTAPKDVLWIARDSREAPRPGDPHPRDGTLVVTSRTLTEASPGNVRISINYGIADQKSNAKPGTILDIRYESNTVEEAVSEDINGNPIKNNFAAFRATINRAVTTVEVDRLERGPPTPRLINEFAGHINEAQWSGYPPRTWLMFSPRSRRADDGKRFVITYQFAYRKNTWDHVVEQTQLNFVTASTGQSPFSATGTTSVLKGVTIKKFNYEIYERADFNQLGFRI